MTQLLWSWNTLHCSHHSNKSSLTTHLNWHDMLMDTESEKTRLNSFFYCLWLKKILLSSSVCVRVCMCEKEKHWTSDCVYMNQQIFVLERHVCFQCTYQCVFTDGGHCLPEVFSHAHQTPNHTPVSCNISISRCAPAVLPAPVVD